jgi:hypothetical protein
MRFFNMLCTIGVAVSVPAVAQEPVPDVPPPTESMTAAQQMIYEGWGVDQQAAYDSWPANAKEYFWTLSPTRQELFFRLSDNDKLALVAMPEEERDAAWNLVEGQMESGAPGSEPSPEQPSSAMPPPTERR